jgi:hypothetical protein
MGIWEYGHTVVAAECEGHDSQDNKIGSASKIWKCQWLLQGGLESKLPVSLSNLREKAIEKKNN